MAISLSRSQALASDNLSLSDLVDGITRQETTVNQTNECVAIQFGQTVSGSIDNPGEVDCFTFDGTAGERVRMTVIETSGDLTAYQELLRPDGSTVPHSACSSTNPTTAQETTCLLDVTGTHTILIRDPGGTGTGTYDLHLMRLNNPLGCQTITYDQIAAGNIIDSVADVNCFIFDGAAGERVRMTVIETSGDLSAYQELLRPDGSTVPHSACSSTNPTTAPETTCLLDVTGPHTILIRDSGGTDTGTYDLHLMRLNNPLGCTILDFDSPPITNLIDPIADTDCYIFNGDEGDQVQVTVVEISGDLSAYQELLRPDGSTIPHSACSSTNPTTAQESTCLLDVTGPHTVLVRDAGGLGLGEYQIGLACLNVPCGETAVADLSITKTDSPDPVVVGNTLTYTLTMTNSGPSAATNVTVVDDLPDTVIFGSATPSQESCEESGGIVTCNLGHLSPLTSATITISVTPTEAGVITNTADVSADQNDLIPDNSASQDTTVSLAGTSLWIEPPEATFPMSTNFTVDVMVANVTDLYGIELELTFDPTIVEVVDDDTGTTGIQIQPGACPSPDFVVRNEADNPSGTIRYATTSLSPSPPCDGSGVIASITFHGLAEGSSPVHFNSWLLSDTDLNTIPVDSTADGTLNVLATGTLEGTVDVQGRADESGAEVCAWQVGAEPECTTTDAAGYYSFSLPADTYDVFVEMARYLDAEKAAQVVVAGGTTTLCQVKVLGGDANDDDVINILDLSFIGFRFDRSIGDPGWDVRADINNDGTINILDLVGAGANFGKTSPVPWPCP
jgi:uncharacterized repeat protein (TIGR01451 family)